MNELLQYYLDKIASVRVSFLAFILLRLFTQSKATITVMNAMNMSRRATVIPAATEAEVVIGTGAAVTIVVGTGAAVTIVVGTGAAVAIVVATAKQKKCIGKVAFCIHQYDNISSEMLCILLEFCT